VDTETFPEIPKTPANHRDWLRIGIYNQLRARTIDGDATAASMLTDRLSIHVERDEISDTARVVENLAGAIERAGVALVRMPEMGQRQRMSEVRDCTIALGNVIRAIADGDREREVNQWALIEYVSHGVTSR
jgi:hypothetical protein